MEWGKEFIFIEAARHLMLPCQTNRQLAKAECSRAVTIVFMLARNLNGYWWALCSSLASSEPA